MMPRFLDVEASSLSMDSYPIEVAWSDNQGKIESHLINPYSVDNWTDWDYNAQQIHGISRKLCREEGVSAEQLCRRMKNSISRGEVIYADGGGFDRNWIDVLFQEGTQIGYAKFDIVHSDAVMLPLLQKTESDEKKVWQLYEKLKLEARKIVNGRHRAKVDVQYLIELYQLCVRMNGAHIF